MTHELYLRGSGFTKVFPPLIVFAPPIEKEDYTVQVSGGTSRSYIYIYEVYIFVFVGGSCLSSRETSASRSPERSVVRRTRAVVFWWVFSFS